MVTFRAQGPVDTASLVNSHVDFSRCSQPLERVSKQPPLFSLTSLTVCCTQRDYAVTRKHSFLTSLLARSGTQVRFEAPGGLVGFLRMG